MSNASEFSRSKLKKWCINRCKKISLKRCFPILSWLPHYSVEDLKGDVIAGITVGLTVIPQGLALSQLASLPPQYGLYTAFMGSFMYSIFGTCKDLVIGPTSVMALMTKEYAQLGGPVYAVLLTFICGCIQLMLGFFNLGFLVNFISAPVLSGFTSSAAVIIATSQLKGIFGLKFKSRGFLQTVHRFFLNIHKVNFYDMSMGIGSIFILLLLKHLKDKKINLHKLPSSLQHVMQTFWWLFATARNALLVIICSAIASGFLSFGYDVFTFTEHVNAGLPSFAIPAFSLHYIDYATNSSIDKTTIEVLKDLGSGAVIIPFLSVLEAVAIAKVFSKSKKFESTREIIAVGMGNFIGSFVQSYPVTGSFSRTVINNSSGVRTPLGGIFSGSLVLLALGLIAPYFHYIPKACLCAIIFSAVIYMIHYKDVPEMWNTSRSELLPFLVTFTCSICLGLEYGLLLGISISLVMLIYRQNVPVIDIETKQISSTEVQVHVTVDRNILFPSVNYLKGKIIKALSEMPADSSCTVIIHGDDLIAIDYTAVVNLKSLANSLEEENISIMFNVTKPSVVKLLSCLENQIPFCKAGQELQDLTSETSIHNEENSVPETNSTEPLLSGKTKSNSDTFISDTISERA